MEKTNNSERTKDIIEAFKQLSVEEMEKILIELGIPTNKNYKTIKSCVKKRKKLQNYKS